MVVAVADAARVLQRLRAQVEGHQPLFSTLESDLNKAKDVNERMLRGHSERDVDLDRYRERIQQLLERWQAILAQIDVRQRELDQLGRQLRYYRESYDWLMHWIQDARQRQEQIQSVPVTDSKAVREQLLQEKVAPVRGSGAGVVPWEAVGAGSRPAVLLLLRAAVSAAARVQAWASPERWL